jgi:ATP-dependent helicase/DNAse subunit B
VILAAIKRRLESSDGRIDARLKSQLATAESSLRTLSDELDVLRRPAAFSMWVDRLLVVASKIGIPTAVTRLQAERNTELAKFETEAWDSFVRLLEEAKSAASLCGTDAKPIGLADFRRQLLETFSGQTCGGKESEVGRVRVLAAEQVRNLDVPHLFVCGMNEGVFPQSRGDDCLFGDGERHRLTSHGLPLNHRFRHSREEMLLFYGVVTRARQTLTLSYSSVNDAGEPLNPSPYLDAVLGLFERGQDLVSMHGGLDPVPKDADACATEAELRAFATSEALEGRVGLLGAVAQRASSAPTIRNLAAAAEMTAARFSTRGLTNYEGVLSDPRNLKRLRQRYGASHEFSATELETYAENPFRYFLTYVLGLEPLAEPGPATDHARRGSAVHAALAAMHRRVAAEGLAAHCGSEALVSMLREALEKELAAPGDSPLQRSLRRIEREVLSQRAERFHAQWEGYLGCLGAQWDLPPLPTHLEVPFGNAPSEAGDEARERHPVVEFGEPTNPVRVRGRIDRIDLGSVDGKAVFTVIDYKLARSPKTFSAEDVELGRALQLVLYSFAAKRIGLVEAELFQFGFWSINGDGFTCGLKQRGKAVKPLDAETAGALEQSLDRVLPRLVDSIRSGRFPLVADDPAAMYNPDYSAVARVSSFRSVAETLAKTLPGPADRAAGSFEQR